MDFFIFKKKRWTIPSTVHLKNIHNLEGAPSKMRISKVMSEIKKQAKENMNPSQLIIAEASIQLNAEAKYIRSFLQFYTNDN